MSVLVSTPASHCVGAQPFLQFTALPASSPERRMGQSPCPALPRRKPGQPRQEQPSEPSGFCTPTSCRPPAPDGSGNQRKGQAFFFFPSSLLTQTHLDFICLRVFHFLFWKAVRVLPVPFITGGCVTLKERARKAENPALTRAGAGLPPTPLRPR